MNLRTKPISLLYSMDRKTLWKPPGKGWVEKSPPVAWWAAGKRACKENRALQALAIWAVPHLICLLLAAAIMSHSRFILGRFRNTCSQQSVTGGVLWGFNGLILIGCANHHFFLFCRSGCARRVSSVSGGSSIVQCRLHRFAARSGLDTGPWRHAELSRAHNIQPRYTGEHTKPDLASS